MRLIITLFCFVCFVKASYADLRFRQYEFPETDFIKTSLEGWMDIRSGGVGKDGISALDRVEMIAVAEAKILAAEPVINLELLG